MKILMPERMEDMQKIVFFAQHGRGKQKKVQCRSFFVLPVFIY